MVLGFKRQGGNYEADSRDNLCSNVSFSSGGIDMGTAHNKRLDIHSLIKNNDGFIAMHMFSIFLVAVLIFSTILIGAAFGGRKMAVMTYQWFGESMNYSTSAAAMYGYDTASPISEPITRRIFEITFSEMTDTTYTSGSFQPNPDSPFPGPITLDRFEALSGHGAQEPGYIAEITVPVLGTELPLVGKQYITVPMRYFAAGKNEDA